MGSFGKSLGTHLFPVCRAPKNIALGGLHRPKEEASRLGSEVRSQAQEEQVARPRCDTARARRCWPPACCRQVLLSSESQPAHDSEMRSTVLAFVGQAAATMCAVAARAGGEADAAGAQARRCSHARAEQRDHALTRPDHHSLPATPPHAPLRTHSGASIAHHRGCRSGDGGAGAPPRPARRHASLRSSCAWDRAHGRIAQPRGNERTPALGIIRL